MNASCLCVARFDQGQVERCGLRSQTGRCQVLQRCRHSGAAWWYCRCPVDRHQPQNVAWWCICRPECDCAAVLAGLLSTECSYFDCFLPLGFASFCVLVWQVSGRCQKLDCMADQACCDHNIPAMIMPAIATTETGMVKAQQRSETADPRMGIDIYTLLAHVFDSIGVFLIKAGGFRRSGQARLHPSLVSMSPAICTATPSMTLTMSHPGPSGEVSIVMTPMVIPAAQGAFRAP